MGKAGKEKGETGADRKERLAAELRANLKRRKTRSHDGQAAQDSMEQAKKQPD